MSDYQLEDFVGGTSSGGKNLDHILTHTAEKPAGLCWEIDLLFNNHSLN